MRLIILSLMILSMAFSHAQAADEKIDPATYICAELTAANVDGEPPLFEGLQIDGFYSAKNGVAEADADIMAPLLIEVSDSCASQPTDKVITHWAKARKNHASGAGGKWNATAYKCSDYAADPDDGSGFVIWLDAYNRAKKGKQESVLSSQEAIDNFIQVCKDNPDQLMLDIIDRTAR